MLARLLRLLSLRNSKSGNYPNCRPSQDLKNGKFLVKCSDCSTKKSQSVENQKNNREHFIEAKKLEKKVAKCCKYTNVDSIFSPGVLTGVKVRICRNSIL